MEEALFEKIVPDEKNAEEVKVQKKEETKEETKEGSKEGQKKVEPQYAEVKKVENYSKNEFAELASKLNKIEKRIRGLEDHSNVLEDFIGDSSTFGKKIDNFEDFLVIFREKLNEIESARNQISRQASKIAGMHDDISTKLEGLDAVLKKMQRFDQLFDLGDRLEDFESNIKNEVEQNLKSWNLPLDAIENLKKSLIVQNFLVSLALLQAVKDRSVKLGMLESLTKNIEEMKKKDLWDFEKRTLFEEVIKNSDLQSIRLV